LFDYAFKEYARRVGIPNIRLLPISFAHWKMASGEDLDWFWRGWFYSTEACDISLDTIKYARADVNGDLPKDRTMSTRLSKPLVPAFDDISKVRNREDKNIQFATDVIHQPVISIGGMTAEWNLMIPILYTNTTPANNACIG
jgi:hypothetical protein